MSTKTVIRKRRSTRNFIDKKIPQKFIGDILDCGRMAPSAGNRQPWYFVIADIELKNKIANMMLDYASNYDDTDERKKLGRACSMKLTANVIKQAAVLILILREDNKNWITGDNLSLGACVQNMCLRATELGIGSLWIRDTVYVAKEVAKIVGHSDMEFNCALALGYTNQKQPMMPRKKLEEIIEWYHS